MSKVKTSDFDVKTSKYKILYYQRRTQNKDAERDVRNQKTPKPLVRRREPSPGGPVQSNKNGKSNFDVKIMLFK